MKLWLVARSLWSASPPEARHKPLLLAGASLRVLQFGLPRFSRRALRLADAESAAAQVFRRIGLELSQRVCLLAESK